MGITLGFKMELPWNTAVFVRYMIWVCLKMDETPWNAQNMPVKMRFFSVKNIWNTSGWWTCQLSLGQKQHTTTQSPRIRQPISQFSVDVLWFPIDFHWEKLRAPPGHSAAHATCRAGCPASMAVAVGPGPENLTERGSDCPFFQGPSEIPKVELMGIIYYYIYVL